MGCISIVRVRQGEKQELHLNSLKSGFLFSFLPSALIKKVKNRKGEITGEGSAFISWVHIHKFAGFRFYCIISSFVDKCPHLLACTSPI
jgi:hypothetical protein